MFALYERVTCTAYYTIYCGFVKPQILNVVKHSLYRKKFLFCVRRGDRNGRRKYRFFRGEEKKGLNFPSEYGIIRKIGLNIIFPFPLAKMKGDSP